MKCILLSSGGLDSLLVEEIMEKQNIETKVVEFKTPFFGSDKGVDISEDFIEVLKNPKFGYGKNLNPCIDCKILMLKKAKELLKKYNADFIVTGEVAGQRPMSQNKDTLFKIEKEAGFEGLVLRPLSAKNLPETFPEKNGWVDREKFYDISGRSRKTQMQLAEEFDIKNYPTPSGGCILTDAGFSMRMIQLMKINPEFNSSDVELIKNGRLFKVGEGMLVVGRNEQENNKLVNLVEDNDAVFDLTRSPGPFAILRYDASFPTRIEAEKIVRGYI